MFEECMAMKVLLMDLDIARGKTRKRHPFPNLALMKLSAYHKQRGAEVYLNFPLKGADLVYASCVFTWNKGCRSEVPTGATIGGSGIDLNAELPPDVEHIMPDYTLYASADFSLGFTSRGCPRRCPWCIVPVKEGSIKPWASIYEFWNGKHTKITLLDNNLLAAPNWKDTLSELAKLPVVADFNQGLDIRLLDDERLWYLTKVRTEVLRFAFDDIHYENAVRGGIEKLLGAGFAKSHISFYVLVGFNDDKTAIERMDILRGYGVDVYPMVYRGEDGKEAVPNLNWGGTLYWRGARNNLRRFLRVVGRLA